MEPILQEQTPESVRPTGVIDVDSELVDDLSELIEAGQEGMFMNIAADLHSADLASVVSHLEKDLARQVLEWLPIETAAEVLAELDDDYRADIVDAIPNERLAAMIDELYTDDAADVLADLPLDLAEQIIPVLEDAEDLKELLAYEEDSAGGLMAAEYVSVMADQTVAQATEEVRAHADAIAEIFALFVVDDLDRLVGIVPMKKLLLSPARTRIGDIMDNDIISVPTDMDQEDVARLMERYDLVTMPVVDRDGCLVGRITIDDIVDVIRDEAEEDIQRMSGVAGGEEATDSVLRISRGRLPWLLLGLAGASLAALVILSFEASLAAASILAGFIPIVMATAGNAGIQSSAIAVQGLASGDIWASEASPREGTRRSPHQRAGRLPRAWPGYPAAWLDHARQGERPYSSGTCGLCGSPSGGDPGHDRGRHDSLAARQGGDRSRAGHRSVHHDQQRHPGHPDLLPAGQLVLPVGPGRCRQISS